MPLRLKSPDGHLIAEVDTFSQMAFEMSGLDPDVVVDLEQTEKWVVATGPCHAVRAYVHSVVQRGLTLEAVCRMIKTAQPQTVVDIVGRVHRVTVVGVLVVGDSEALLFVQGRGVTDPVRVHIKV